MMIAFVLAALVQDQIDNLEYKAWASFKPGSSVTFKTLQEGKESNLEQKVTLKSVGDGEVVLQTEMISNGAVLGKGTDRKVAAKVPEAGNKKVKEGEEEIEVAGKKMKCRWVVIDKTVSNGKEFQLKFWGHDDVPGHAVRIEIYSAGTKTATMVATAWEKK